MQKKIEQFSNADAFLELYAKTEKKVLQRKFNHHVPVSKHELLLPFTNSTLFNEPTHTPKKTKSNHNNIA